MSATLWIDTAREETIELGGTLPMYASFSELAKAVGADYLKIYPDLFGVPTAVEDQEDADPEWLKHVAAQAAECLRKYPDLSGNTRDILTALTDERHPDHVGR